MYGWGVAGGTRFPSLLATHLNEYLEPYEPILPEHIRGTGACTALHDILAWAIAEEGDGILVSRPVYGRFELDFTNRAGVKVVYADTDAENCFDEDVADKYERAIVESAASGVPIKAVLIVNPNNPLGECLKGSGRISNVLNAAVGKCYPRNTLINIMKLCEKHQIHLISDEIYACSVFDSDEPDATPFTSALSINPAGIIDPELLHIEYGFSKDFGLGGMKVGAIVSRSQPVLQALGSIIRFHNPSGPAVAIANALLEDREWCRSHVESTRGKLAAAYKHATSGLREIGVKYLRGSNAGFFVWIDLSPYLPKDLDGESNEEFALAKKLQEAGVFLHPKEEHSSAPGWFRFVYTHHAPTVTEGLRR